MKNFKKIFSLLPNILFLLYFFFTTGCEEDNPVEPDPNSNLLPGVAYIGHGYNVFGDYAKAEFVKSPLFEYDDYSTVTVGGKSFNIPSEVQYT